MANIYDKRKYGTLAFMLIALVFVALFLYISNRIVADLAEQERSRMEIWADATKTIINMGSMSEEDNSYSSLDIDFLLKIIEENRNIPVMLVDDDDHIILHRNFDLPEPIDSLQPLYISDKNFQYLSRKLQELQRSPNVIHIIISPGIMQHLYYEDSKLLRLLNFYPYVQVLVMLIFVTVVYFAVMSTKKAEQNKVWVGLSKETAHQLGTPISSLMAWMEILDSEGVDPEVIKEMNKDVNRLSTIASRFGKIGSNPTIECVDLNTVVQHAVDYMSTRISNKIELRLNLSPVPLWVKLSTSLFEWVLENLIKNAVDAMNASGSIEVTVSEVNHSAVVRVHDSGKGIPRKRFKTIFSPGYTTKKRGWGLGLTLAKRIIQQYHGGKIFVESSEIGSGTTFRIDLPLPLVRK